jgi:hypothetical protein
MRVFLAVLQRGADQVIDRHLDAPVGLDRFRAFSGGDD